jgi:hypothetical protein
MEEERPQLCTDMQKGILADESGIRFCFVNLYPPGKGHTLARAETARQNRRNRHALGYYAVFSEITGAHWPLIRTRMASRRAMAPVMPMALAIAAGSPP